MKTNCVIQTTNNERTLMSGKKIKVLLIMADKGASDNLRGKLSGYCELSLIDNPLICKGAFVDDDTDVIVIDEIVGSIMGSELCSRIKNDKKLLDIPIILLISSFESDCCDTYIQCGANRLVVKNTNPEILKADIQMLVENSSVYRKKIEELRMKMISATIPETTLKDKKNLELMEKVFKLMDEHPLSKRYFVQQLCKDVGMSQSSFYDRIKKITGHSPEYLLNEYKMRKAAEMIIEQELQLLDIAVILGYCDTKYFSKKFKEYHHVCPSKYLESLKNNNDTQEDEEEN